MLIRIEQKLNLLLSDERIIMATLDDVEALVAAEPSVIDSLKALIVGLEGKVTAAAGDQAKIDKIFAEAKTNADKLSAALLAGTPAAAIPPAATGPAPATGAQPTP
jgi:hypothetical protein